MAVDHQSKIKIKEISIVELRGADLTRLSQGSWSWSEMAIHISPTAPPRVVGLYLLLNDRNLQLLLQLFFLRLQLFDVLLCLLFGAFECILRRCIVRGVAFLFCGKLCLKLPASFARFVEFAIDVGDSIMCF